MERLWLVALMVLWAVFLFGGFAFGKVDSERIRRMPAWTRMASSFTLVIAAWSFTWLYREANDSAFALLIAVGMTLGFIGDLYMARLLPMKDYILGGIGAFGLGHIAYIAAQINIGQVHIIFQRSLSWMPLLVWLLIGAAGWYIVVYRTPNRTPLHYAALPYALLLATTAGLATVLATQSSLFSPLAIGTALFLASDLILAARLFNNVHFYLIDDVVWLLYGPAQMLIIYSIGSALVLPDLTLL
jgi:hypothetical protein